VASVINKGGFLLMEKEAGSMNTLLCAVWCWVDESWIKMMEMKQKEEK